MKLTSSRPALAGLALTVAASALAQPLLAPAAQAATDVPATSAARASTGWLATQLTSGIVHNDQFAFDDYGLTVDIGISMDEVGGDQALVRQIRQAVGPHVDSYVSGVDYGVPEDLYSGSLAKALVFAQVSGADARSYGGYDLVSQVEDRVTSSGPSRGRLADRLAGADYANSFGQAFAARGLSVAGSARAGEVTDFLLEQQCSAGFFRIFFNSDPNAADQGCVEGTDGIDTDTTALVVAQLAAIPSRSAQVDAAIAKAVAWLVTTQKADGSFFGSEFTPDSNTNSTGLAASALAAAGRCEQAGRAAEWVSSLQVGPQPAGSPLAGEEGALAYSADTLATARTQGITVESRDQWRRATVQAVAGLTHVRGSVQGLTVSSSGTQPGSSISLAVTGAESGDRFCLTGPGIDGSRSVAVTADGTLTGKVVLPATAGAATYTHTGRDGATTHTVVVAATRGSVSGVRLAGPAGFTKAGSKVALEVLGAAPGARFVLRGPGLPDTTVVAASDGVLTRTVTLPKATTTAAYVLVGSDGQVGAGARVLGKRHLKVSALAGDGPRTRVLVRRLAAREKVQVVVAGRTLAKGRANPKGRFVARVALPDGRAEVRVRAVGQFPSLRSGSTSVTLR